MNTSHLESLSPPLRYRITQLTGNDSVPCPVIADHPRTIACAKLIDQGIDNLAFHGFDTLESILKVFGEHGIDRNDPYYRTVFRQVESLNQSTPQLYRGLTKPGLILDELRAGGAMLIRAAVLARAGIEDETTIQAEIDESLDLFSGVVGVAHQDEVVIPYKDKYIVRSGVFLPSYYHLMILASTHSWRTTENIARVRQAVTNLCRLALPHALMKFGSQLVAPASLNERHWVSPEKIHYDSEKAMWVERMILLLQAGIVDKKLSAVIRDFATKFVEQWAKDIHNTRPFLKWGAYSGVALEPDWKSRERKTLDLWFRAHQMQCLLSHA